jgi:RHS repeat-associated protein
VRTFTYNSIKQLLTAQNPESGLITYAYDPVGNMLQKISPQANQTGSAITTISYCYDPLNRPAAKAYTNSPATPPTCATTQPYLPNPAATYTYDSGSNGIGHLTSLTDQAGSGIYSYDPLGRMTAETRTIKPGSSLAPVSKNMSYGYNLDGSLAKLVYPSNATVTYTPDTAGHVLSAVDTGNPSAGASGQAINYATSATYGPDGGLTGFVSGASSIFAGITNSFSYNKRLQPVNMSATTPSGTIFSLNYDFHLGVTNNGNVWGITNNKDTSRSQTFGYDPLNRLISAKTTGSDCSQTTLNPNQTRYWGNSYSYDAWGNLLTKTVTQCGGEHLNVSAGPNNQLQGYGYDSAGNMTHDATANLNYSFDQENRITGANGFTYTYDADGNRVAKANGSTGTLYWYMSPGIVAESDLSGNLQSEYMFFDGERVARRDNPGTTSGSVSYYFSDHLTTTDIVTDAQGNIKNESDFYPWGGELEFLANDSNHYKFTGKERDSETGLDYFGARYYSNGLGRFITPDWSAVPIPVPYADVTDPQSLNQYSYVRNIPTVNVDADGHDGGLPVYNPILLNPFSIVNGLEHAAQVVWEVMTGNLGAVPPPSPMIPPRACPTPGTQQSNDPQNKNQNNSQSSNVQEQPRDAQGKFLPKQGGEAAPGSAAEKEALEAVGATKNTETIPGSNRIPDGRIADATDATKVAQYVEGKSGAYVGNTAQLREMAAAAKKATGKPLKLVTNNPNVKIADTVRRNRNIEIVQLNQK